MKSISKVWIVLFSILSCTVSYAQIRNSKTETVKVYGNCDMCKATIEKAGNLKKIAKVDWNKDTKMATLTYNFKKTSQDEILKRIALSGYDSDKFLAPDEAYAKLASCCQYERKAKVEAKMDMPKKEMKMHEHRAKKESATETSELTAVFDSYYALKDALVSSDAAMAASKGGDLQKAIESVKIGKLAMDVHMVWMKVFKDLAADAKKIADSKDLSKQRSDFTNLSKNMYGLMKASPQETPTYFQHCPMANGGKGADWLSKEDAIKNPYFGSQMLSCGKTVETIKQ